MSYQFFSENVENVQISKISLAPDVDISDESLIPLFLQVDPDLLCSGDIIEIMIQTKLNRGGEKKSLIIQESGAKCGSEYNDLMDLVHGLVFADNSFFVPRNFKVAFVKPNWKNWM